MQGKQRKYIRYVVYAFTSVILSGCAASQPKIALSEYGLANTTTGGSFDAFAKHYTDLQEKAKAALPIDRVEAHALVKSGASLSYQLCSTFFKTAGAEQQYLLFSRDIVSLVGTAATGILGAAGGSSAAIAALGIGSGAALSGISIYSRNFLFSEDNVQGVENLTLSAMSAATNEALTRNDYDFDTAVNAVMDIQSVCEVQHILSLVRQSISSAKPLASSSDTPAGTRIEVSVEPATPTSGNAQQVPIGTSQVPRTRPISQHIKNAIPVSVDPTSVEAFITPSQGRAIQAAICLKPDAGTVDFGSSTREAITSFRSIDGLIAAGKGLTLNEASRLISSRACNRQIYRNAFEAFHYSTAEEISKLQRKLATLLDGKIGIIISGVLDAQTRKVVSAIQEAHCQQKSGTLSREFLDSLVNPIPKTCTR